MRLFNTSVLIILSGVGVILCWSNWQPITLFFLGNSAQTALFKLSLPLAVWVLIFIASGFTTGVIIQLLNRMTQPTPSPRRPRRSFDPPSSTSAKSPQRDRYVPDRNWENPVPDEWNIEEPPPQATNPQYSAKIPIKDSFKADSPPLEPEDPPVASKSQETASKSDRPSEVEVPQSPQKTTREGSVYTYTYRSKNDSSEKSSPSSRSNNRDQVYDAPYRVITPPSQETDPEETANLGQGDEDWI